MEDPGIGERRAVFPRGLEQPQGSYRFGTDALVLAQMTAELPLGEKASLCELGTGCGAAAFAVLIDRPGWIAVGLEKEESLCAAAVRNADALGLGRRFRPIRGDAGERSALLAARDALGGFAGHGAGGLFDAVFCNPPWKDPLSGRIPRGELRREALFAAPETIGIFFSAADRLLKVRGSLVAIAGSWRTADMLAALPDRLRPERLHFFLPHPGADAELTVLIARKNGRARLKVSASTLLAPLALRPDEPASFHSQAAKRQSVPAQEDGPRA